MGTNYYFEPETPRDIFVIDEDAQAVHIGKHSGGWQFTFRSHPEVKGFKDWVRVLENIPGQVYNEYGVELNPVEFSEIVKNSIGQQVATGNDGFSAFRHSLSNDGFTLVNTEFC